MRKIYVTSSYDNHTCFECVGFSVEEQRCKEKRSVFYNTHTESVASACKDIQYYSLRNVNNRRRRKKIESIYDYE